MQFSKIIGQDSIKENFITLFKERRVPHAMLLSEKEGSGALPLALAFISYMLCPNRTKEDSCGVCPICNRNAKLIHPDLHFAMPVNSNRAVSSDKKPVSEHFMSEWRESIIDNPYLTEQDWYSAIEIENKSGNISVNEANLMLKRLSLSSFEGGDKFLFIWQPQKMNLEAANKILKLIEEPPLGTYIFMVSNSPEKIIPTILSRCLIIRVPPVDTESLTTHLSKEYNLSVEEARHWAKISSGSVAAAKSLIGYSQESQEMDRYLFQLLESSHNRDLSRIIDFWENVATFGREKQRLFLTYTLEFIRATLMFSYNLEEISGVPLSKIETARYWSQRFKPSFYSKAYDILNTALEDVNRNVNPKYIFADISNRFFVSL